MPRRAAAPRAAREYQPGHFTELIVRNDWPPGFAPAATTRKTEHNALELAEHARRNREAGVGFGQGGGTLLMGCTPYAHRLPGWLKK
jgi:hypothetical protein